MWYPLISYPIKAQGSLRETLIYHSLLATVTALAITFYATEVRVIKAQFDHDTGNNCRQNPISVSTANSLIMNEVDAADYSGDKCEQLIPDLVKGKHVPLGFVSFWYRISREKSYPNGVHFISVQGEVMYMGGGNTYFAYKMFQHYNSTLNVESKTYNWEFFYNLDTNYTSEFGPKEKILPRSGPTPSWIMNNYFPGTFWDKYIISARVNYRFNRVITVFCGGNSVSLGATFTCDEYLENSVLDVMITGITFVASFNAFLLLLFQFYFFNCQKNNPGQMDPKTKDLLRGQVLEGKIVNEISGTDGQSPVLASVVDDEKEGGVALGSVNMVGLVSRKKRNKSNENDSSVGASLSPSVVSIRGRKPESITMSDMRVSM